MRKKHIIRQSLSDLHCYLVFTWSIWFANITTTPLLMKNHRSSYSRTYYNGKTGKCQPWNRKLLFTVDKILYQFNHNHHGKYGNGCVHRNLKSFCNKLSCAHNRFSICLMLLIIIQKCMNGKACVPPCRSMDSWTMPLSLLPRKCFSEKELVAL